MNIQELLQAISPYLKTKEGQLWLLLLTVILAIVLATLIWQSAESINLWFSNRQTVAENTPSMPLANKPAVKSITDAPLFGQGELPGQINTHYQLMGVLFAQDPKQGKAIIGSPNREPEIYKVDQDLKEGGKLYQVNADHVLILRNGQIEKLYLTWEGGAAPTAKGSNPTMAGQPLTELPTMSGDSEDTDSQAEAEAWRQRIKELQQKYQNQINTGGAPAVGAPGPQNNPTVQTPGVQNPSPMPGMRNLPGRLGPRMMRGGDQM